MSSRDQALHDIFVTALEGGIGYWSTCSIYHWSTDGEPDLLEFGATIIDTEDLKAKPMVINRALIEKGAARFIEVYHDAVNMPYFLQAATCLRYAKWDDLDVDASIADCIVQFGLFGAVVYG